MSCCCVDEGTTLLQHDTVRIDEQHVHYENHIRSDSKIQMPERSDAARVAPLPQLIERKQRTSSGQGRESEQGWTCGQRKKLGIMSNIDIESNNNWKFFDWSGTLICRLATDLSPQNASTNSLRAEGVNACDICSNHVAVYRAVTSFYKIIAHILVSYCVCFEKMRRQEKVV